MLAELQSTHAELREAIAALQGETARAIPHEASLAAARLRLSRASGRRRSLLEASIYPSLRGIAGEDAHGIAGLRAEGAAMLILSSEHIGRWTMRAIVADWAGYRQASAALRAAMIRRIAAESTTLYPLLVAKAA